MGNIFGGHVRVSVPAVDLSLRLRGAVDGREPVGYAKDAFHVFYGGREVPGATATTFEELRDGYGKDAFRVFYRGELVPEATAITFEVQQGGYAKDAFRSFFRGRPMGEAMGGI